LPALAALIACGLLVGCEKSAEQPGLGNPFDPDGPTGGDGLQIRALASPGEILLIWQQPQGLDIAEYLVYRADSRDGPYTQLAVVTQTTTRQARYTVKYPSPTQTHWFRVQAFTAGGTFSLASLAVPASAAVGPTVIVGDTVRTLATRYPQVAVTVGFGDTLLVGLNDTYTNALRVPVVAPGVPTVFSLDLGAAAPDDTFRLYVKAFDDLGESLTTQLTLPVSFAPKHFLAAGIPLRLTRRVNDLTIPATGLLRMRFASTEAGLATADWLPGSALYPGYELADSANPQQIWGEFEGDFGFNTTHVLNVKPDLLGSATFHLNVSASRVVPNLTVTATMSAAATEMRLSENPGFATVPWVAYADSQTFVLSAGEGTKTVYAQFRNDWTQSAILSDYCIHVSQGPDVKILAPRDGNVVGGGSTLIVHGTSSPGTVATKIDSVRLDLGDGLGFREVIGTDSWQLAWAIPHVAANTTRVLRARVWAGLLEVTDLVSVTIADLTISITSPLAGARLVGGSSVSVSGTAAALPGGAPVDSVVVDIGATHLVATGTVAWNTTWNTPVVAADTPADITATVWAGGQSAAGTVNVTLTP
jgi:hypothetical protein